MLSSLLLINSTNTRTPTISSSSLIKTSTSSKTRATMHKATMTAKAMQMEDITLVVAKAIRIQTWSTTVKMRIPNTSRSSRSIEAVTPVASTRDKICNSIVPQLTNRILWTQILELLAKFSSILGIRVIRPGRLRQSSISMAVPLILQQIKITSQTSVIFPQILATISLVMVEHLTRLQASILTKTIKITSRQHKFQSSMISLEHRASLHRNSVVTLSLQVMTFSISWVQVRPLLCRNNLLRHLTL